MEHIHSLGVVHRDIQPSNIVFFSREPSCKLLVTDSAMNGDHCSIQYTPMYACPEVIDAKEREQATVALETSADMWCFGGIAFDFLTGEDWSAFM